MLGGPFITSKFGNSHFYKKKAYILKYGVIVRRKVLKLVWPTDNIKRDMETKER